MEGLKRGKSKEIITLHDRMVPVVGRQSVMNYSKILASHRELVD